MVAILRAKWQTCKQYTKKARKKTWPYSQSDTSRKLFKDYSYAGKVSLLLLCIFHFKYWQRIHNPETRHSTIDPSMQC